MSVIRQLPARVELISIPVVKLVQTAHFGARKKYALSNVYNLSARSASMISVYRPECFPRVSVYTDTERT